MMRPKTERPLGRGVLLLAGTAVTAGLLLAETNDGGAATGGADGGAARGRALYDRHCAVCHGPEGRGDGSAAYLLYPAPRDFGSGRFRLVSTGNGVPTVDDLVDTLRRGMPGSAMPPWEWFSDEELRDTALHVQSLAIEGQVADLLRRAEEEGDDLSGAEARAIAEGRLRPGEPIAVPAPAPSDPVTLHEGRRLYRTSCASCHGDDGTGSGAVNLSGELVNEDGTPNSARDFTAGIFKGGSTHADLVRRVVGGLPGSPMPGTAFEDAGQVAAVVAFVRSLVEPAAEERVTLGRRTLAAARAEAPVPTDPTDLAWTRVEGTWIALMPLWWRDQRVEGVVARALHDGETVALHLSWSDPTHDDDLLGPRSFSDAAALQTSFEADPPLFAMGAEGAAVGMALWRAAWRHDADAARDVRDRWPGMVDDGFSALLGDLAEQAITARAAGNSQAVAERPGGVEQLRAQGLGTVSGRVGAPSTWTARGTWSDGYWDVVFTRPLGAADGREALEPGRTTFLALAVWDGSFGDRNGQKSVSVWHRLELAEEAER